MVRPSTRRDCPARKGRPQFYHKNKRFDGLTLPEPDFRDVLFRVSDVLKEFPPEVVDSARVPQKPKVNVIFLKAYLKETATPDHTQEALRILAEQAFPGHHITDALFRSALRALPTEQKRPRGGTDRTMRLLNSAK
jgi:hypothetical protein